MLVIWRLFLTNSLMKLANNLMRVVLLKVACWNLCMMSYCVKMVTHTNQRNKEIEAYDYILERCEEPCVSYTHDINFEE